MNRQMITIAGLLICLALSLLSCMGECKADKVTIEKENKALVYRIHTEISNGNQAIFNEVLSPDYIRHCQAMPPEFQELEGTEIFKGFISDWLIAVPDNRDSVLLIIAENDMVAYVTKMTGTQTGPLGDLPASGKAFELTNIIIHRIENGLIVETWVSWDNVALLSQLGFFPPPAPSKQ